MTLWDTAKAASNDALAAINRNLGTSFDNSSPNDPANYPGYKTAEQSDLHSPTDAELLAAIDRGVANGDYVVVDDKYLAELSAISEDTTDRAGGETGGNKEGGGPDLSWSEQVRAEAALLRDQYLDEQEAEGGTDTYYLDEITSVDEFIEDAIDRVGQDPDSVADDEERSDSADDIAHQEEQLAAAADGEYDVDEATADAERQGDLAGDAQRPADEFAATAGYDDVDDGSWMEDPRNYAEYDPSTDTADAEARDNELTDAEKDARYGAADDYAEGEASTRLGDREWPDPATLDENSYSDYVTWCGHEGVDPVLRADDFGAAGAASAESGVDDAAEHDPPHPTGEELAAIEEAAVADGHEPAAAAPEDIWRDGIDPYQERGVEGAEQGSTNPEDVWVDGVDPYTDQEATEAAEETRTSPEAIWRGGIDPYGDNYDFESVGDGGVGYEAAVDQAAKAVDEACGAVDRSTGSNSDLYRDDSTDASDRRGDDDSW